MRKIFILMMVACVCLGLTSCNLFDIPAKAERIGADYVQRDDAGYFIKIDQRRYPITVVIERVKEKNEVPLLMEPIKGMWVTAFRLHEKPEVYFIAGDITEKRLEVYFTQFSPTRMMWGVVVFSVVASLVVAYILRWTDK